MTAVALRAARRPITLPPRVGTVRAAAAAAPPADRGRADLSARRRNASSSRTGRFATERTHVSVRGDDGVGRATRDFQFHVTSGDWQESDQVLAGILTDFGSPTGAVTFGGRGEFDGVMTGPFRRPRVEGVFTGEDLRAWDTLWGVGVGAHRRREQLRHGHATASSGTATRRFAPTACSRSATRAATAARRSTRASASTRRDLDSLRHAFEIDDYPVSGRLIGRVPPDRRATSARSASAR